MRAETSELLYNFEELESDFSTVNNLTRETSKRDRVISAIEDLQERAGKNKTRVQSSEAPAKCANRILAIELMLMCWRLSLEMWNSLRSEDWESAWEELIRAQRNARWAVRADYLGEKLGAKSHNKRLELVEKLVFPKQIFTSPGMTTGTAVCSICDQDYATCPHIKGKAYNGELCRMEIQEIKKFDHLAIVDNPDDKLTGIRIFD